MIKFDIQFICKNGQYKLNDCKKIPTTEEIQDCINDFNGVGLGRLNQIVIDVKH